MKENKNPHNMLFYVLIKTCPKTKTKTFKVYDKVFITELINTALVAHSKLLMKSGLSILYVFKSGGKVQSETEQDKQEIKFRLDSVTGRWGAEPFNYSHQGSIY